MSTSTTSSRSILQPTQPSYHTLENKQSQPNQPSASGSGGKRVIQLRGIGSWISYGGLYTSYDESYPIGLTGILSEDQFRFQIVRINDNLANNAPCCTCQLAQYLLCPCTLGCSILCVRNMCMDVARETLLRDLETASWESRAYLKNQTPVEWKLKESMCDSWLEIEIQD